MNDTALVRQPSTRLAEGIVTHISRTPVDVTLARAQHAADAEALAAEKLEGCVTCLSVLVHGRQGHSIGHHKPRRHREGPAETTSVWHRCWSSDIGVASM